MFQSAEDSVEKFGCYPDGEVALYQKVHYHGDNTLFPINTILVDLTVRNSKDPLLAARSLTDQSLDFGISSHDLRVVGILMIFISVCAGIKPVLFIR